MLARNEQPFNGPVMSINERKRERKKEKENKEKELELLREEIALIKKKTEENYKQRKEAHLFSGAELRNIDIEKLTDSDLNLFRNLKDFKNGKIIFDKMAGLLSKHRAREIAPHQMKKLGKYPDYDFRKDSREAFMAWVTNKALYEKAKMVKKEKKEASPQRGPFVA